MSALVKRRDRTGRHRVRVSRVRPTRILVTGRAERDGGVTRTRWRTLLWWAR